MPLALFSLFVSTFAIATTEFAVVGLLPEISADLAVTIPEAGLLVSVYAAGVAIGGPAIVMATTGMARKPILMRVCRRARHVSNGRLLRVCAHEPCCGGCLSCLISGNGSGGRREFRARWARPKGSSRVWLGFSATSLIGVPAGTALGEALGWRSTFWAIAVLGLLSVAMIASWVPSGTRRQDASIASEFRMLKRPQVLIAMALSLFVCAITFSVFTFIVPMLRDVTGIDAANIPYMLLLFGVGGTAGLAFAGRYAAMGQLPMVLLLLLAQLVTFLMFTAFMDDPLVVAAVLVVWGFLFLAPCVPLQTRVVERAIDAPNLASTLNQATFNIGNAIGPLLGASALSLGLAYTWLPILGVVLTAMAVALALVALKSDRSVATAAD